MSSIRYSPISCNSWHLFPPIRYRSQGCFVVVVVVFCLGPLQCLFQYSSWFRKSIFICFHLEKNDIYPDCLTPGAHEKPYLFFSLSKGRSCRCCISLYFYLTSMYRATSMHTLWTDLPNTLRLLHNLDPKGRMVTKTKLQFCQPFVKFLGHLLTSRGSKLWPFLNTGYTGFPRTPT